MDTLIHIERNEGAAKDRLDAIEAATSVCLDEMRASLHKLQEAMCPDVGPQGRARLDRERACAMEVIAEQVGNVTTDEVSVCKQEMAVASHLLARADDRELMR